MKTWSKCPKCGKINAESTKKVSSTYYEKFGDFVYSHKKCLECGYTWKVIETLKMQWGKIK